VLKVPRRGLGRAYIDAIPHIRGRFVIMGDADCTYDFRDIRPFVEAFRAGAEFVMGSRFKGSIAPGETPSARASNGCSRTIRRSSAVSWLPLTACSPVYR
jgi:glycosyltransferase involved in cell wall biosynthesis